MKRSASPTTDTACSISSQAKAKRGVAIVMTLEPMPDLDEDDGASGRLPASTPAATSAAPASRGATLLSGASGRRYHRLEGKPRKALDETFARLGDHPLGDLAILPVLADSAVRTYRVDDGKAVAACVMNGDRAASTTFLALLAKGAVLVVSDAFVLEKPKKRVFATMMSKANPAELEATLRKRLTELEKAQGDPVVLPSELMSAAKAWEAWWAKQARLAAVQALC